MRRGKVVNPAKHLVFRFGNPYSSLILSEVMSEVDIRNGGRPTHFDLIGFVHLLDFCHNVPQSWSWTPHKQLTKRRGNKLRPGQILGAHHEQVDNGLLKLIMAQGITQTNLDLHHLLTVEAEAPKQRRST